MEPRQCNCILLYKNVSFKSLSPNSYLMCYVLRDFVSFLQFKNREKYPFRSVTLGKVSGFNAKHLIYFSEAFLDSSIFLYDIDLEIPGYKLVHSDHPPKHNRGGVSITFSSFLPFRILDIHKLQKIIVFNLQVGSRKCNFIIISLLIFVSDKWWFRKIWWQF